MENKKKVSVFSTIIVQLPYTNKCVANGIKKKEKEKRNTRKSGVR